MSKVSRWKIFFALFGWVVFGTAQGASGAASSAANAKQSPSLAYCAALNSGYEEAGCTEPLKRKSHVLIDGFSDGSVEMSTKVVGQIKINQGRMEIYLNSIELDSNNDTGKQNHCAPNCPFIHSISFMLTRDGRDRSGKNNLNVLAESKPIPLEKILPEARALKVNLANIPSPILLSLSDKPSLFGVRLTLDIKYQSKQENKYEVDPTHSFVFADVKSDLFWTDEDKLPEKLNIYEDAQQRNTQALQAIFDQKHGDLKLLIRAGIDINARDVNGQTLLMDASENGDLESVQLLLAHGAKVNATALDMHGHDGRTALHAAMKLDAVEVVDALYRAGANPEAEANSWTPMLYAAYLGAPKSIRYLHKHHVNIETPFRAASGSTPLMVAVEYGQLATIRVLLELGADPKRKDPTNTDSCGYAEYYKQPESAKILGCK